MPNVTAVDPLNTGQSTASPNHPAFFLDFATSALFESGLSLPAELCDWDC